MIVTQHQTLNELGLIPLYVTKVPITSICIVDLLSCFLCHSRIARLILLEVRKLFFHGQFRLEAISFLDLIRWKLL